MRPHARELSLLTTAAADKHAALRAATDAKARELALLLELDGRVDRATLARAVLRGTGERATQDAIKLVRDAVKHRVKRARRRLNAGDTRPENFASIDGAPPADASACDAKDIDNMSNTPEETPNVIRRRTTVETHDEWLAPGGLVGLPPDPPDDDDDTDEDDED